MRMVKGFLMSFLCSVVLQPMALLARNSCLFRGRFSQPRPAAFVIGRFSQPRFTIGRRSFADESTKPQKPEAKPAATSKKNDPPAPNPNPSKTGFDPLKIAPDMPSDPKNPLHNQSDGRITQGINETPDHVKNIADAVTRLNLIEVAMLNKLLDEKIGVPEDLFKSWIGAAASSGAPAPAAGAPGAPAAAAGAPGAPPAAAAKKAEEKKKETFNLKLVKFEESAKIKLLKEIRVLRPGMNLAETKALTDKLPSILKDSLPKEEAEKWVAKLKELGATVELE